MSIFEIARSILGQIGCHNAKSKQTAIQTGLAPASSTQSSNLLATAVSQLAQDLKSGNLTAAQSDFATVQQDLQQAGPRVGAGHAHHHHYHGDADSGQIVQPTELHFHALRPIGTGSPGRKFVCRPACILESPAGLPTIRA